VARAREQRAFVARPPRAPVAGHATAERRDELVPPLLAVVDAARGA
jgi:hypothetical protein